VSAPKVSVEKHDLLGNHLPRASQLLVQGTGKSIRHVFRARRLVSQNVRRKAGKEAISCRERAELVGAHKEDLNRLKVALT